MALPTEFLSHDSQVPVEEAHSQMALFKSGSCSVLGNCLPDVIGQLMEVSDCLSAIKE